ncbi:MAG TPA: SMR family transporter [Chitinophaga sp.]
MYQQVQFILFADFCSGTSLPGQPLPIGTAYAVWTGIGAVGTVLLLGLKVASH